MDIDLGDSENLRRRVAELIENFEAELRSGELREKVLALIPIFHVLRKLGQSLLPEHSKSSARDRILSYFQKYPGTIIHGDELLVISAIQEYARRIRELRVQYGWMLASGYTIKDMMKDDEEEVPSELRKMRPAEYILLSETQDRDAAHRWHVANEIRKQKGSVQAKILAFLRANVHQPVTNEELRYVAKDKTEWARRVRELRTEEGWPIATKTMGMPDLPIGVYVLQADRQSPSHDRVIPDHVRREVLRRDGYQCTNCGWRHEEWNPSDPRHLELHHIKHHADRGENTVENLRTLCTVCHDQAHKKNAS